MGIRSEKAIYQVLEKHLRDSDKALTCVDLIDHGDVFRAFSKEYGGDKQNLTNKVSDALGFMWRRGLLTRFPAPMDSKTFARFSYIWDKKTDARPMALSPSSSLTKRKTGFVVNEYGDGILIEFEHFTVWVRPKTKE